MTVPAEALYERFRTVAAASPDRTAVIGADGEHHTYRELSGLADAATQALSARLGGEDTVVVEAERSPRHLAALLAAWRLGLAYVPLRHHETPARRAHVLRQLGGRALLVSGDARSARVSRVDPRVTGELAAPLRWPTGQAAYVVFTSGSTGTPKGTVLSAEGFANRLDWSQDAYPLTPDDVLLQHTAVSFDFAVWETAAALLHGVPLLLTEDGRYTDPEEAVHTAVRHGATVAHFVPSVLSLVEMSGLLADWPSLRLLYSGGEQLRGPWRHGCCARHRGRAWSTSTAPPRPASTPPTTPAHRRTPRDRSPSAGPSTAPGSHSSRPTGSARTRASW